MTLLRNIMLSEKIGGAIDDADREFASNVIAPISQRYTKVNYGGCGAIAKLIYYAIKKYFNVTPEISLLIHSYEGYDPTPKEIDACKHFPDSIQCNSNHHWYADHVVIMLNDSWCLDSKGLSSINNALYENNCHTHVPCTIQQLMRWVSSSIGWNDTFKRHSIPNIAKFIDKRMKEVQAVKNANKLKP
mgnify:CR=1 FL=1